MEKIKQCFRQLKRLRRRSSGSEATRTLQQGANIQRDSCVQDPPAVPQFSPRICQEITLWMQQQQQQQQQQRDISADKIAGLLGETGFLRPSARVTQPLLTLTTPRPLSSTLMGLSARPDHLLSALLQLDPSRARNPVIPALATPLAPLSLASRISSTRTTSFNTFDGGNGRVSNNELSLQLQRMLMLPSSRFPQRGQQSL